MSRISNGTKKRAQKKRRPHQFPPCVVKSMERMAQRRFDGRWDGVSDAAASKEPT